MEDQENRKPPQEKKASKKLLKNYELGLLLFTVLLIGFIVANKYGFSLTNRSEKMEWTDGRSHENLKPPKPSIESANIDSETEDTVRELAELFANSKNKTRAEGGIKRIGLTQDEENYYKKIHRDYGFGEEVKKAQDWFAVLKTAGITYKTMKEVFKIEQPNSGNAFYDELENQFGIPTQLSKEFAKRGKKQVSDWAMFVEKNK